MASVFPRLPLATFALVLVMLGTSLLGVAAQDAPPVDDAAFLGPVATPGGMLPGDPQIQLVEVAGGFADPVNVASANDGSGRLFVVERVGTVRVIDEAGAVLPEPFLDISGTVKTDFLEQGLLGLAFHPDYATTGLFYVFFSDYRTNGDMMLAEYAVSAGDPNIADPESVRILLTQDKPYTNHNGGTLRFGPDGYLYIALGDGGLAGDPYDNAQKIDTWLGKLLRIDVNARDAGAYGIPADNPYADTGVVLPSEEANQAAQDGSYHPAAKREICNWGLRNPWQFSFDPGNGELYVADVGQNAWEEVNYFPAGQSCGWNLGWDDNEGASCYPAGSPCQQEGALPVAVYSHVDGCSITGVGVYRGQTSPALDGIYFNTDFCSGSVFGLARDAGGAWIYQQLLTTDLDITGAGQDEAGELYVTACTCVYTRDYDPTENPGGTVWRIVAADQVPEGATTAPVPTPEAAQAANPAADGATPAATPATAAGSTSSATEVTVEMVDLAFNPSEFTIPANMDVTVTLPNNGAAVHNFNIDAKNNPSDPGIHSGDVVSGQSVTVTINLPAGDWYFYCNIPGHEAAGMYGTIHVQ